MKTKKPLILMIEDDVGIRLLNKKVLNRRGIETIAAASLSEARKMLREPADLILLDILLPDGSGLDFVSEIRAVTAAPILMLTSKKRKDEIVEGLLGGGDDYLTKPYKLDELYARIIALLRREQLAETYGKAPQQFGRITMDAVASRAYWDGEDMLLKPKEYGLLWELLYHKGQYIPGYLLYEKVWGTPLQGDNHTVRTHIYRLRKKIEGVGGSITIEQEKNRGYRLVM